MAADEENPMHSVVAACDAALADKPCLASVYDETWRRTIRAKLLGLGRVCYMGNAFAYQAPFLEECGLIRKGWQYKLEEAASVLFPRLSRREFGHLAKRMRDTESTSAEEETLLAGGFAQTFGLEAIQMPQMSFDKPRPEFEVNADGHRILVEAKGRPVAESVEREREQTQKIESLLGIRIQAPPPFDEEFGQWIKNTVFSTLRRKSSEGDGLVLVLSLYTMRLDFGVSINIVRELATDPGNPTYFRKKPGDLSLADEHWALAMALVSGGSVQGVWFNSAVRDRLRIGASTQERLRAAIKNSFCPWESGVFFHEGMSDDEHRSELDRVFGGRLGQG